jgi:hypothetical protein
MVIFGTRCPEPDTWFNSKAGLEGAQAKIALPATFLDLTSKNLHEIGPKSGQNC